jgi:hypothetical protein
MLNRTFACMPRTRLVTEIKQFAYTRCVITTTSSNQCPKLTKAVALLQYRPICTVICRQRMQMYTVHALPTH